MDIEIAINDQLRRHLDTLVELACSLDQVRADGGTGARLERGIVIEAVAIARAREAQKMLAELRRDSERSGIAKAHEVAGLAILRTVEAPRPKSGRN